MFKILWITAAIIVGIGWIGYGVWRIIDHLQDKKRPKPTTKHLEQIKKSFEEYAKKLEKFEKPTYERDRGKQQ